MDCLNERLANIDLTTKDESNNKQDEGRSVEKENNDNLCITTDKCGNTGSSMSQESMVTSRPTSVSASSSEKAPDQKDAELTTEHEYTQFFFDKSDLDPNFVSLVEQLTDIFPTISKTDLKIRLKLSEDVEQLMEELFIECEQIELIEKEGTGEQRQADGSHASQELKELKEQGLNWYQKPPKREHKPRLSKFIVEACQMQEIFPHLKPSLIEQVLIKNNGDMDAASIDLLDPDYVETEPSNETRVNAWSDNTDLMNRLKLFLDIDNGDSPTTERSCTRVLEDEEIKFHIRKCLQDYSESLKSIVVNCRPRIRQEVIIKSVGGRVQRGGLRNKSRARTETRTVPSTYKYNPDFPESSELQQMYLVNEELHTLDQNVLINALEFFEGNCDKVLQFACEVLSSRSVEQLPTIEVSLNSNSKNSAAKQASLSGTHTTNSNDVYANLSESFQGYSTTRRRSSQQVQRINSSVDVSKYVSASRIDLHGKTSLEALALTQKVLESWWQEEVQQRIEHGKLSQYGSAVIFVDSLKIVTGRGIHSANGVSILRPYVKNYLVRNQYVFDEGVGNFEVKGKRKK
ncbi:hypothetical protein CANMA_000113 [Candida margitis]|uniref:uncharacterized protein n=1 Tax=Candida margitis TaxID=1775924 RepID=UPI0022269F25|nr:uncharacterized protein CANMA_000113 [Candida margitis]KAI5970825.1 hypothetical protein CANMA_000113 [Candida margitis]